MSGAYGLKNAQMDLLGWDAKGDTELEAWLIENGHIKGTNKKKADTTRYKKVITIIE
jgi:hypothetical protein